jgi:carbamoyltransferase
MLTELQEYRWSRKIVSSVIRQILEEWYDETGCPMLLNTSLNIKGMPIVDTWDDAMEFSKLYNVQVF